MDSPEQLNVLRVQEGSHHLNKDEHSTEVEKEYAEKLSKLWTQSMNQTVLQEKTGEEDA